MGSNRAGAGPIRVEQVTQDLVVQRNFIALEQLLTVSMADGEGHDEAYDEGVPSLSF